MHGGFNASHELNQLNLQHTKLTALNIHGQKKPLIPILPNTLRRLSFKLDFNHPIHEWRLPASITQLDLGTDFNQPLDGVTLPASLIKLKLGESFNQPVENIKLPPILHTFIIANEKFDQPIEALVLPSSLRVLDLSAIQNYTHPLAKLRLPPHLHSLSLPSCMRTAAEGGCGALILPVSLRHLTYYVLVDGEDRGMSIEEVREMMSTRRDGESDEESESDSEREMSTLKKKKKTREDSARAADHGESMHMVESDDDGHDDHDGGDGMDGGVNVEHADSDADESCSIRLIGCADGKYRRVVLDPFDGIKLSPFIQLHRKVGKLKAPIP